MFGNDKLFVGSIPELYDRFLVPLIFDAYAVELAERVAQRQPLRVLEVAAGTGVVSRALADRLPADTQLIVTDLNPPMLEFAKTRQDADSRIEWRQADALDLPFKAETFDAVVCQFGAMFFPDRSKAYAEARRVLREGGSYWLNVWDRIQTNEFADVVTQALAAVFPDDPPRFLARTPHGYHDEEQIRRELSGAGFRHVKVEWVEHRSKASEPRNPAIAYCQGTPLRAEIEARDPAGLEQATAAVAEAIARRFGMGPVDGRTRALLISAT